jgi:hypothetical protein
VPVPAKSHTTLVPTATVGVAGVNRLSVTDTWASAGGGVVGVEPVTSRVVFVLQLGCRSSAPDEASVVPRPDARSTETISKPLAVVAVS